MQRNLVYLPVILADQLGYFRKDGLDVCVLSAPAGIDSSTRLVAGAVEGAVGYYDHTIELQSHGMDVQSVIVLGKSAGLVELTSRSSGIRTMFDARGRRLGVTGFGSSTFYLTRFLSARVGVPSDSYNLVPLANEAVLEDALSDGKVDAGMTEELTASLLLSQGATRSVVDLRSEIDTRAQLGGPHAGTCVYMRRQWIDAHQSDVTRLVRAVVAALTFIHSHSAQEIESIVPASLKGRDTEIYRRALSVMKPAFSATGQMPSGAPSSVLAMLSEIDEEISEQHVDLDRTWTDRFIDDSR